MLSCTAEFDATVTFYRDVLGLAVAEPDVATVDTHFSRYACAVLPTGGTLEVVEPAPAAGRLHGQQILCFKVDDLLATRDELERRGATFASDVFDNGAGLGWTYVQAPGANIYQVYGPLRTSDKD